MNGALAHRIYAGADMFLMPSMFEPCGLSQLISLRYGTLPIVRETGGLRDTVTAYNEFTGDGNGFSFFNYNAHDMLYVIERAVDYYKNRPEVWHVLMKRAMSGQYGWDQSAGHYIELYESLIALTAEKAAAEKAAAKKPRAKKTAEKAAAAGEPSDAPAKKPRARKCAADAEAAPAKKPRAKKAAASEGQPDAPAKKPHAKKNSAAPEEEPVKADEP